MSNSATLNYNIVSTSNGAGTQYTKYIPVNGAPDELRRYRFTGSILSADSMFRINIYPLQNYIYTKINNVLTDDSGLAFSKYSNVFDVEFYAKTDNVNIAIESIAGSNTYDIYANLYVYRDVNEVQ